MRTVPPGAAGRTASPGALQGPARWAPGIVTQRPPAGPSWPDQISQSAHRNRTQGLDLPTMGSTTCRSTGQSTAEPGEHHERASHGAPARHRRRARLRLQNRAVRRPGHLGDRSGLRHEGRPGHLQAPLRPCGHDLPFLLGRVPDEVRGRSREIPEPVRGRRTRQARRRLHLPDAPADPPGGAGQLPDLRHGAGTARDHRRGGAEPRAGRHVAPLLDRPGADPAGVHPGDGRPCPGLGLHDWCRRSVDLDPVRAGDARGAVGGLAVLPARLGVGASAAT